MQMTTVIEYVRCDGVCVVMVFFCIEVDRAFFPTHMCSPKVRCQILVNKGPKLESAESFTTSQPCLKAPAIGKAAN